MITFCYGKHNEAPVGVSLIGPCRDEHREISPGRQAEDLFVWPVDRMTRSDSVLSTQWVHPKGALYEAILVASRSDGWEPRVLYVSMPHVLRPGTRLSLRRYDEFHERFFCLGDNTPWAGDYETLRQFLGYDGLAYLRGYGNAEEKFPGLFD